MKSKVIKRSVVIDGHKTSVSLEDAFWNDLKEIAYGQQRTRSKIIAEIDKARQHNNLSSAIRLFVFDQVRMQVAKLKNGVPIKCLWYLSRSYVVASDLNLRGIYPTTPIQSGQLQKGRDDKMRQSQIFNMKVVFTVAEYLGLVFGFYSQA